MSIHNSPFDHYEFLLKRSTKKGKLATDNEVISANDRLHHHQKARLVAKLRLKGSTIQPQNQYNPQNPCSVVITIHPPTKRRMDPPNFYPTVKALIDGFTDAGQWSDDNSSVIKAMTFIQGNRSTVKKHYQFDIDILPYHQGVDSDA